MGRKSSVVAQRTWDLLRELLWARKGEFCRNKLAVTFHIFHKLIGKMIHSTNKSERGALLYGDHELSFKGTPLVHVRMHRPSAPLRFRIPCIHPPLDRKVVDDDDDDDDDDVMWSNHVHPTCFLEDGEVSDEEIDKKAEEFIAKFYEDMKMQRQISYM